MENELFNLQKKIMDLESKLNYGPTNGGSGESGNEIAKKKVPGKQPAEDGSAMIDL